MEHASAVALGTLIALMSDVVVFVPAIALGMIAGSWKARLLGGGALLALVLMIKVPVVREVAREFQRPDVPLAMLAAEYAAAIGVIVLLVVAARAGVRRIL